MRLPHLSTGLFTVHAVDSAGLELHAFIPLHIPAFTYKQSSQ